MPQLSFRPPRRVWEMRTQRQRERTTTRQWMRSSLTRRRVVSAMARERKTLGRHFGYAVFLTLLIRQKTNHGVSHALTDQVIGFPVAVPVVVLA